MISCIISSRDQEYIPEIRANVQATIGVPYEIIVIDSKKCRRGIAEAYNKGAQQARYDLLCFMHKDILFRTPGWGNNVITHFENSQLGMLGIAGSTYKTRALSSWWQPRLESYEPKRMSITHSFPQQEPETILINPKNEKLSKVVSLDGVLLIMPKKVWSQYPFDEKTLSSFHCYDLDSGLTLYGKYDVAVAYDISLEHFSPGFPDTSYFLDLVAVHEKHKDILPIKLEPVDEDAFYRNELAGFKASFRMLKNMKVPASIRRKHFFALWSYFLFPKQQFKHLIAALARSIRK